MIKHSASSAGFHFHNRFACCQRKGYISFGPPRLEPLYVATPLLVGSAFHAGKAEFYRTGRDKQALTLVREELKERKREFESRAEYLLALDRAPAMLDSWIQEYGKSDLRDLSIVAVEKEIRIPFPGRPNWRFSMRVDLIAEDQFDNFLIYETKTSSWSMKSTLIHVKNGDQVTAYWGGVEKHYKRRVTAVVPDITFFSQSTQKTQAIKNFRDEFIYREPQDIDFFYRSMSQRASEISQKMSAVYSGGDPAIFDRNDYYCQAYNRPCEFAEICRMNLTAKSKVPAGFRKRAGKFKTTEIFEPLDDVISGG